MLLNLEMKHETNIRVFMVVETEVVSWRAMMLSIVVNGFRSAGFCTPGIEAFEAAPDCASRVQQYEDGWEHLCFVD
ncbi:hypothetical protein HPB48_004121 [Haemaphysalis longicornis]|uniref:Uncharacterized protein n=1 Tax=Haemaphysalis longicornis TaxID=44386 RepID=A0A9J6FSP7_HAELO|nr:hypothetical protein HPB48_004121 [Haemaphysalis longicornis]